MTCNSLQISVGLAVPKLQIVLKPQLKDSIFWLEEQNKTLHLSAFVVGQYGETISGVKVRFNHMCFDTQEVLSDFDGSIHVKLHWKSKTSASCQTLTQDLLIDAEDLVLTQQHTSLHKGSDDTYGWTRSPLLPKQVSFDFKIKVKVYASLINSQRQFSHAFRQHIPSLQLDLHPLELIYKKSVVDLIVTLNTKADHQHNWLTDLQTSIDLHYTLEEILPNGSMVIISEYKDRYIVTQKSQRLKQLFPLSPLHKYRLSLNIKTNRHPAIKVHSKTITVDPRFLLQVTHLEQSSLTSKLSLFGQIKGLGYQTMSKPMRRQLLKLIQDQQLKVSLSWRLKSPEVNMKPGQWTQLNSELKSNGTWQQDFILPQDQETQLRVSLLHFNPSSSTWVTSGDEYVSTWLKVDQGWIKTYIKYILTFFFAFFLIRKYRNRLPSQFTNGSSQTTHALEVAWLSELDIKELKANKDSTVLLCNALSKRPIKGYIEQIDLEIFGAPKRWQPDFKTRLQQSKTMVTLNGVALPSLAGQTVWVTAEGYEPLLIKLPQGTGCLVLPLWPLREAILRIWNEVLVQLDVEESLGRGRIQSIRDQLENRGGSPLLNLLDETENKVYVRSPISFSDFNLLLSKMNQSFEILEYSKTTSLLYPPNDEQRSR